MEIINSAYTKKVNRRLKDGDNERVAKNIPLYPMGAERELARVTTKYAISMIKFMKPYIKQIMSMYKVATRNDSRFDDYESFRDKLATKIIEMSDDFYDEASGWQISKLIERCGNIAKSNSINDWVKLVKETIGYAPSKEFYDDLLEDSVKMWTEENVNYITSLPSELLSKVQEIVLWGYETKQPLVNVYVRLEKQLGITKSQARMIARDQIGTLNSRVTRFEHESMGCSKYVWKSKHDERVRECHRELDGTIQSWNNPPLMWYMTLSGKRYTGRACHPGEDYGCRCVAIPVFDVNKAVEKMKS